MINNLQFTGYDFFADKDVCSIVLELPTLSWRQNGLACGPVRWTVQAGKWVQVDRGALPAQAVLLVGAERDSYLVGEPADDARFVAGFSHALEHAGGYARKLSEACVRTTCTRYIGTIHDFVMLNALADTPAARGAVGQAIAALRSALA